MSTARDHTPTITGPVCAAAFTPTGRQRHCSTTYRQTASRRRQSAPIEPLIAHTDTVYMCPDCDTGYLAQQRCDDCNTGCRRLGPGGLCPCCDESVAIGDLFNADQLTNPPVTMNRRK